MADPMKINEEQDIFCIYTSMEQERVSRRMRKVQISTARPWYELGTRETVLAGITMHKFSQCVRWEATARNTEETR